MGSSALKNYTIDKTEPDKGELKAQLELARRDSKMKDAIRVHFLLDGQPEDVLVQKLF